jgi:hypothetical protein
MKAYVSLFKMHKDQPPDEVFSHFYAIENDYDEPYKIIAKQSLDGVEAWAFQQEKFKNKHRQTSVPKLKNYLNYTFKRLVELETNTPGKYFILSTDGGWIAFNTGLHNAYGADLLESFRI